VEGGGLGRRAPLRVAAPRGSVARSATVGSAGLRPAAGSGRLPSGAPCGKRRRAKGTAAAARPTTYARRSYSIRHCLFPRRPLPSGAEPKAQSPLPAASRKAGASRRSPSATASPRRSDAKRSAPQRATV